MHENISKLLKELEKTGNEFWNITHELGEFLNELIKKNKYKSVLEIGSSNGYSGIWIAQALSENTGKLYTMESNKERFLLAKNNFQKSGLKKHIIQIKGHAPEDIPATPPFFDMAFFDATKYEHLSYFEKIKKRIRKNGIIVTDNIFSHKESLTPYIQAIEKEKNWLSKKLNIGSGILLSKRIA